MKRIVLCPRCGGAYPKGNICQGCANARNRISYEYDEYGYNKYELAEEVQPSDVEIENAKKDLLEWTTS